MVSDVGFRVQGVDTGVEGFGLRVQCVVIEFSKRV